jgi:CDGSH-type Zn-finger protein
MSDTEKHPATGQKQIKIVSNGPYVVQGQLPLVHKTQIVSEHGEPLTWSKDRQIKTEGDEYYLCRCGKSSTMPFCDHSHREQGFDGSETAITSGPSGAQLTIYRGPHLIAVKDPSLCMSSGFCGFCETKLPQLIAASDDTRARSLAIAMMERCPSGSYSYKLEEGQPNIEPDLPQQIADTTEVTSYGPIQGPLWVTGYVEIVRSDGQPFEPRNRVTLCNCGLSSNKPLCDGTHRAEAERKAKNKP